jgi:hypothetical protein
MNLVAFKKILLFHPKTAYFSHNALKKGLLWLYFFVCH